MDDLAPPDPTLARDDGPAARVGAVVAHTRFSTVRWVAETGSTNADVVASIRDGAAEGLVVVADHQTAGRGRRGRTWQAPPGAALMGTVLLRPPADRAGLCTMALALAASQAVEQLTGLVPQLKWPNDLVWPGTDGAPDRKLAGILAEAEWPAGSEAASGWRSPPPDRPVAVAAGIGLNVNWGRTFPDELRLTAVALDELTAPAPPPEREDLLVALLEHLEDTYATLLAPGGPEALLARWRARSATLGRRVRVDLGVDDVEGLAVDITEEGHLVVETLDGERRTLAVGDVVHLRATEPGRAAPD